MTRSFWVLLFRVCLFPSHGTLFFERHPLSVFISCRNFGNERRDVRVPTPTRECRNPSPNGRSRRSCHGCRHGCRHGRYAVRHASGCRRRRRRRRRCSCRWCWWRRAAACWCQHHGLCRRCRRWYGCVALFRERFAASVCVCVIPRCSHSPRGCRRDGRHLAAVVHAHWSAVESQHPPRQKLRLCGVLVPGAHASCHRHPQRRRSGHQQAAPGMGKKWQPRHESRWPSRPRCCRRRTVRRCVRLRRAVHR